MWYTYDTIIDSGKVSDLVLYILLSAGPLMDPVDSGFWLQPRYFWGGDIIKSSQKTQKVEYIRTRMEKPDWKLAEELDETLYYVWLVKEVKRNPKLQRKRGHIKH